jgi:XTP/dITP diphosphohydrolase
MDDRVSAGVLLATSNPGKVDEFRRLLPSNVEVTSLLSLPIDLPPEDGESFAEIASAKAEVASSRSGMLALGDDSGLEVEALGGMPGVYSARYSGEPVDAARNREKLFADLGDIPENERRARFRCSVALAFDGQVIATSEGYVEGAIGFEERGSFGFGYDSMFVLPDGRTMAEVPPEEKNRISHRAMAFRGILPSLLEALAQPAPS